MPTSKLLEIRSASAGLTAFILAACGGPGPVETTPPPVATAAVYSSPEAIAKARADSARVPYTAADVHFMSGMIAHHAQAIQMSRLAKDRGAGPPVQRLADRIINAQVDEIRVMQQWLSDRLQPIPEPSPAGMKMRMNGVEHVMLMPGMVTPEQMRELEAARGTEFDRLFLTFMLQHHKGAISMVKELLASHGGGQEDLVFKLASDINVDQATEIARMEQMLLVLTVQKQSP